MVDRPDAPKARRNPPILTTRYRKTAIGLITGLVVTAVLVQTLVCFVAARALSNIGK
jgi:hypothetical protein